MPPPRVLLIGHDSPPRGGVQAHVSALRDYLVGRGVPVEFVDLSPNRKAAAGVHAPGGAAGVMRLLLTLGYDVAHLHIGGRLSPRLAILALLAGAVPGRRAVLTFHSGGYPSSPEGRAARPRSLRGFALRRLDALVAVNEEIAAWFRQVGVASERVRVVCPYALPSGPQAAEPPEPLRSFLARHSPLLVSAGGLEEAYDLPLQIEVLGQLREKFPRAGLVLLGDGVLREELRRRAAEKPYGEHVLLCGDVGREVALRVIAESDLMLRTTLYDGDSIAVREAVHFGVPVVATDRAPRPEGVRVVPAQDLARLCEAAEQCLSNGARRQPAPSAHEENLAAVLALYEEMLNDE